MNSSSKFCCDVFPKLIGHFHWWKVEDEDIWLMPCLDAAGNMWRINHCPSCGAEVRSIELTKQEYEIYKVQAQ